MGEEESEDDESIFNPSHDQQDFESQIIHLIQMGRLDLVAAAGVRMEEVEEMLDREVTIMREEKERQEKIDEMEPVEKEEAAPTTTTANFSLRGGLALMPVVNNSQSVTIAKPTVEEDKKTVTVIEKQPSMKQSSKENSKPSSTGGATAVTKTTKTARAAIRENQPPPSKVLAAKTIEYTNNTMKPPQPKKASPPGKQFRPSALTNKSFAAQQPMNFDLLSSHKYSHESGVSILNQTQQNVVPQTTSLRSLSRPRPATMQT